MEEVVSQDLKENSKRFWSYVKSKRQEASGVSALLNEDGFLQSDTMVKAEKTQQEVSVSLHARKH